MAILDERLTLADVEPYAPPVPTISSDYTPPEQYTPGKEATVEGRMTGLLSSGSPYIEQARQSGMMTAQQRGLLNTTMAATAGEKAAIESALPIAQQDAASFQAAGMAGYHGKIAGAQSAQEAGQKAYQTSYEGAIAAGLSIQQAKEKAVADSQNAAYQYELQTAKMTGEQAMERERIVAAQQMETEKLAAEKARQETGITSAEKIEAQKIAATQANIEAELRSRQELATGEQAAKAGLLGTQLAAEKEIEVLKQAATTARADADRAVETAKISSSEKTSATNAFEDLATKYATQVETIQRDPNVPTASKITVINDLTTIYRNNINMIAQLTGVEVTWVGVTPTLTPAPAPAPAPNLIRPGAFQFY